LKNKNNYIAVFDDLRGIAILSVVIYHYFFVYYANKSINSHMLTQFNVFNNYFNLGIFGVSLFFLISGFVIPMSFSFKRESKFDTLKKFAIKRFFRLYPTYWFSIIFISVFIFLFKDKNIYTLEQIFINFTMMQDVLRVESIDGVFWTLMIELKFYILSAIFFYFGILKKINHIILFFLLLSVVSLYLGYIDGNRKFLNNLWSYLMLMYLGTSFYFYQIKDISKKTLIFLILIVMSYYFISQFFLSNVSYGNIFGYSIATLFSIPIFWIALFYKRSISRITSFFGRISYSLYLLHQVLGYLLIDKFTEIIAAPYAQLATIFVMTVVSLIVNRYIEIPTNRLGHKYAY